MHEQKFHEGGSPRHLREGKRPDWVLQLGQPSRIHDRADCEDRSNFHDAVPTRNAKLAIAVLAIQVGGVWPDGEQQARLLLRPTTNSGVASHPGI
jgi:hypothetical protein